MTNAAERVKVRCKKCGTFLYTALVRADIKVNLEDLIEVPCRRCGEGAEEDGAGALVKVEPREERRIYCAACKRYICTLRLYREFAELGEILEVKNLRCRCNWKNGFILTAAPDKEKKKQ